MFASRQIASLNEPDRLTVFQLVPSLVKEGCPDVFYRDGVVGS
jgi:hypothetical protein